MVRVMSVQAGWGWGWGALKQLKVREATRAGAESPAELGRGGNSAQRRGLDEGGSGLFRSRFPRWALSTVEGFSGYAVRYLKPEVTQSWRVRKKANRSGRDGWEGLTAGVRAPQAYGFPFL